MNEDQGTLASGLGSKEFTLLVALLMSIVAISIDALLPALGVIGGDMQAEHANQPQLLISMIFLGMASGQLIAGPLSDALGRRPILFIGFSLYLIGTVLCFFANDMQSLLIGRFIQGLGISGPYIAAMSLVRDAFKGIQMAKTMSIVMLIFVMVPAIAPSLGLLMMAIADWKAIFEMYFVYAAILLLWITLRLKETLPKEKRIKLNMKDFGVAFKEVISHRITASYTVCMGLFFGSFIGYLNSSQQIFQDQFKVGDAFSFYFGALALVLGFSSMVNAKIVGKFGMQTIVIRAISGIVAVSAIFLALHAVVEIQFWMFMVFATCLFFCFGMLFGNTNALAMEPMGHIAGIASAVIGCVSSLMSMSLGTLIGQMYDNSLIPLCVGFSCLGSLALCLVIWAERGRKQDTNLDALAV
ncbi:multidrug effflux MFS transporter [Marinomonas mediterranea]|jgi:drug resistance transporter, Bcr/CflA subfamily|uniref:Bcr/CflA family efflux transporter n=1 Tax=Marinomonas mediterranea (strain ATCC 700492 / JCM 21426 / NBRC 103028 / MMB-1) TaxID=717774 RepID=F2JZZ2_MARM1|nr:multidrug effflux MFS transporter [Marinomonas mediterranea]ADZ92104.1 drug resistance transporter, Bcr/CflA subfamily [Marinomonas mediterranea MMB-1]WCN10065.1 Bcr/CflA family efflux MFS transporter [Marinomonas mediterranea]WCN18171.1 Bcr/CflA family efflux MFS transporter [Marinomonas mediterranea MMB-1]